MQRGRSGIERSTRLEPDQDRGPQGVGDEGHQARDGQEQQPPAPASHQEMGGKHGGRHADQEEAQARARLGDPIVGVRQADQVAVQHRRRSRDPQHQHDRPSGQLAQQRDDGVAQRDREEQV